MSTTAVANAPVSTERMSPMKLVLAWIGITLIAFPVAGYAGWGIAGHVDDIVPALLGGAITGAGVGFIQWMFLRRDLDLGPAWIIGTSVALATGLTVGSAAVDYQTGTGDLAIMGAITGAAVGVVQGAFLRRRLSLWLVWMLAMGPLFAIAWVVSATIGVDVENQFTVFGASGCIAFGLLSGLILMEGKRTQGPS